MAAESRSTSIITLVEESGTGQRASSEIVLVERRGDGQRLSSQIVLVEYAGLANYATSMLVLVERDLPFWCKPRAGYIYNGVNISEYCNAIEVKNETAEYERKTLGSTGMPFRAGLANSQVLLKGDWNATIDGMLGRDAFLGTKRTGVATFDDCTYTVSYTWTSGVRVSNWKVTTAAPGKIEWSATLQNNVLGVRSVVLDDR